MGKRVILGYIYLILFDWTLNISAGVLSYEMQVAFGKYPYCALTKTVRFRWRGGPGTVVPTGLLRQEE